MIDHDELHAVASAMIKYGGSFVRCLGEALFRADAINTAKIHNTWSAYWELYLKFGRLDPKEGDHR